jgi:hypothetical protein
MPEQPMHEQIVRVACYSGYKADERPMKLYLAGRVLEISAVEDRWYSPGATFFRVVVQDGERYVLRHTEAQDIWTLVGYRAKGAGLSPSARKSPKTSLSSTSDLALATNPSG